MASRDLTTTKMINKNQQNVNARVVFALDVFGLSGLYILICIVLLLQLLQVSNYASLHNLLFCSGREFYLFTFCCWRSIRYLDTTRLTYSSDALTLSLILFTLL